MRLPLSTGRLSPGSVRALLTEVAASGRDARSLAVGGAPELAAVLARELGRDAAPGVVRTGDDPAGAAVLVHVLGSQAAEADERSLRRARRAGVPVVVVAAGPVSDDVASRAVPPTHVVRVLAGEGFPLARIARTLASRLGEDGAALAARVPLLRRPVCDALAGSFARRNGLVAAAVFVPGADLPLLTLNQLRLVLRIAQAHGEDVGRERLPELAAVVAVGIGLRAVSRRLIEIAQPRWAVQGAVAYAGTRALGEAALRRFELGAARGNGAVSATPPPA